MDRSTCPAPSLNIRGGRPGAFAARAIRAAAHSDGHFPVVNIPVVSGIWLYNGLSAKEIEKRIVYNHERIISARVADIEHIESTSYNGAGVIKVFLQPGTSISDRVSQITASGQAVVRFLPPGVTPLIIIRYNASTVPILQCSLASKKFSEQELQNLAFNQLRVGLMTVRGASVLYPYGGKARGVAVDIDLPALEIEKAHSAGRGKRL